MSPMYDPNDPTSPGRIGIPKDEKPKWWDAMTCSVRTIAILLMIAGGLLLFWVLTQIALSV